MKLKVITQLNQKPVSKTIAAILLLLISFSILTAGIHELTRQNTLGSDFYVFYLAGQAVQEDGEPTLYSDRLSQKAQLAIYKRPAAPGEDELGFAYPPYALLPILPLSLLPFEWAQAAWMAFSILALISALLYISSNRNPALVLSVLFFYPVSFGLILGNFAIPIAAIILACFAAVSTSRLDYRSQILWGALLAWTTCKPQFSWFFTLFLLLLAWRHGYTRFLVSFITGCVVLLIVSFAIVPNWPPLLLDALARYSQYNQSWLMTNFFLMQIMPVEAAQRVTILLGITGLVITIWLLRAWHRKKFSSLAFLAWAAWITYLFHPRGKSYEQITYLIPLFLWGLCRKNFKHRPFWLFWFGNFLFFWITFAVSLLPAAPVTAIEWPLAGYLAWMLWFFLSPTPGRAIETGGTET